MATKAVYLQVKTSKSLEDVKAATKLALQPVGGIVRDTTYGFDIDGGSLGVNFGFIATIKCAVTIKEQSPGLYHIECLLAWSPSALFWICVVTGWVFLGILWLVAALYFLVDPATVYYRHISHLEGAVNAPAPGVPVVQEDTSAKIRQLQEMLNSGLITQQEYDAKKADLLAKM